MSLPEENPATENIGRAAILEREDLCADLEAYIAAKPFRAMAIALLCGIVVGKIIL